MKALTRKDVLGKEYQMDKADKLNEKMSKLVTGKESKLSSKKHKI